MDPKFEVNSTLLDISWYIPSVIHSWFIATLSLNAECVLSNIFQASTHCLKPDVFTFVQCAHDGVGPFMSVIKSWFCVKAEVTTCLLEKEEDTCTEKVLALFSSLFNPFLHSHFLSLSYAWGISIPKRGSCATLALSLGHWRKQTRGVFAL